MKPMDPNPVPAFDPSCTDEYDPNALPVSVAIERIYHSIEPIQRSENVTLHDALGRVSARNITAKIDVPSHPNSAMDGYALRAKDISTEGITRLRIIGTSSAGHPFLDSVNEGQCVRVMTGAVMPTGADTVIAQERAERQDNELRISGHEIDIGNNVRDTAEDIKANTVVVPQGVRISPAELGLIASVGVTEVNVVRRLRVAFFSSGDELRTVGEPLAAGMIYDSNRYTLYGMLCELGVELIDLGVVCDNREDIEKTLACAAQRADAIIASGGVSVGDADFVKDTLEKLGTVNFWKIAMKPGRPLAFGEVGNAVFFGLPGNPVSVMVTFYQFVQAALKRMMGIRQTGLIRFRAKTLTSLRKRSGRTEFQRGVLQCDSGHEPTVISTGEQGSGILTSMHKANCFIVLPTESEGAVKGDLVEVEPFVGVIR